MGWRPFFEAVGQRQGQSLSKRLLLLLVGRNWLPGAAGEMLPRKYYVQNGRATFPLRLRTPICISNGSHGPDRDGQPKPLKSTRTLLWK